MLNRFIAVLGLVFFVGSLCPEVSASHFQEQDENLSQENFSTPKRPRTSSRIAGKNISELEQIYAMEADLIKSFYDFRQNIKHESKETLGDCFQLLTQTPKFKNNYFEMLEDNHIFYLPNIFKTITDIEQVQRFLWGKSIVSPVKKNAFQGHHVQMRNPISINKPAFIWVLTRTMHKEHHGLLHFAVDESSIDRSRFKTAQGNIYKQIAAQHYPGVPKVAAPSQKKKAKKNIAKKSLLPLMDITNSK